MATRSPTRSRDKSNSPNKSYHNNNNINNKSTKPAKLSQSKSSSNLGRYINDSNDRGRHVSSVHSATLSRGFLQRSCGPYIREYNAALTKSDPSIYPGSSGSSNSSYSSPNRSGNKNKKKNKQKIALHMSPGNQLVAKGRVGDRSIALSPGHASMTYQRRSPTKRPKSRG